MARKTKTDSNNFNNNYTPQNITDTLELNYMPYAMSVIVSRALPEIDGFKPAHRKLLYTMYKMGLLNGARTKSTNVVGQTMKLNPHGDQTIYETMVRLTRGNEALLHPFIDSKGNFGKQYSRDMAFAASRYTEVKLDTICNEIFKDIDKDTVDMVDNYDGQLKEPVLFPTTFPNILVTTNTGIAVSMASSICSFNLKEVCNTTIKYIKNPDIDIKKYLKAPDFSTGGELIYSEQELDNIYNTGRGSVKVRAKYRYDKKNSLIEVYEIPYSTSIEIIIDKIISLVKQNKIKEINDIRNETDINGLKIAIDIKRNADPDKLMAKLYQLTTLSDNFSCNFNILVNGSPKTLGIKGILDAWLEFRTNCIRRQTEYDLQKKWDKHHLLVGLSQIMLDIDKAIKIIRETEEDSQVIPNLMKGFNIDRTQAEFVAEIKLRNLNKEYLLNRVNEMDSLENEIARLQDILKDETLIKEIIVEELTAVSKKYGQPRKTEIIYDDEPIDLSSDDFIEDYGITLFLTAHNYFKKITQASLQASIRTNYEHKLKDEDEIIQSLETTNKADVLFFSSKQNVYKVKAYDLAECKASSLGEYLNNMLGLDDDETIVYLASTLDYKGYMLFGYRNGKIAKVDMQSYDTKLNRKKLINAYSNKSELTAAMFIPEDKDIMLVRDNDKAMLVNTALIPAKATKSTGGIQIYNLKKNSFMTRMLDKDEFVSEDIEYYRSDKVPATGHFINETDKNANNL